MSTLAHLVTSPLIYMVCAVLPPETILFWKSMYVIKLFGNMFNNYSFFTLFKWNWYLQGSFFKNPPDGTGGNIKCMESITLHHSEKTTFYHNQLCFYTHTRFFILKTQLSHLIPSRFASYAMIWRYYDQIKLPLKVIPSPWASGSHHILIGISNDIS